VVGSINIALKKLLALAREKKAENIVVLRMKNLNWITNYLFICSANSVIQVKAIASNIADNFDYHLLSLQGYEEGKWVLIDYGNVMVHIFHQATRDFYNLEKLWADAPREKLSPGKERFVPGKETLN